MLLVSIFMGHDHCLSHQVLVITNANIFPTTSNTGMSWYNIIILYKYIHIKYLYSGVPNYVTHCGFREINSAILLHLTKGLTRVIFFYLKFKKRAFVELYKFHLCMKILRSFYTTSNSKRHAFWGLSIMPFIGMPISISGMVNSINIIDNSLPMLQLTYRWLGDVDYHNQMLN